MRAKCLSVRQPWAWLIVHGLDWHRIDRNAHADGARERVECLWLNPAAYQGVAQHDIFRRAMA